MTIRKYLYIASALLMASCSETEIEESQDPVRSMPVLFSAGNTEATVTRATASYMPKNSHFVCSMFFHAGVNDTIGSEFGAPVADVNMTTAWLKISNSTGNAVFLCLGNIEFFIGDGGIRTGIDTGIIFTDRFGLKGSTGALAVPHYGKYRELIRGSFGEPVNFHIAVRR